MDYYAVKINELELNKSTWINLKNTMLRDIKLQKNVYSMISISTV